MFPKFTFGSLGTFVNRFCGFLPAFQGFHGFVPKEIRRSPCFGSRPATTLGVFLQENYGSLAALHGKDTGRRETWRLEDGTASEKRLVEEIDYGGGEAEALDDVGDERRAESVFGGKGGGDSPLPAED